MKEKPETLYRSLMLSSSATQEEIKEAFRRLAPEWHPENNKTPEAAEMFMKIFIAYDILREPWKRKIYDFSMSRVRPGESRPPAATPVWRWENRARDRAARYVRSSLSSLKIAFWPDPYSVFIGRDWSIAETWQPIAWRLAIFGLLIAGWFRFRPFWIEKATLISERLAATFGAFAPLFNFFAANPIYAIVLTLIIAGPFLVGIYQILAYILKSMGSFLIMSPLQFARSLFMVDDRLIPLLPLAAGAAATSAIWYAVLSRI